MLIPIQENHGNKRSIQDEVFCQINLLTNHLEKEKECTCNIIKTKPVFYDLVWRTWISKWHFTAHSNVTGCWNCNKSPSCKFWTTKTVPDRTYRTRFSSLEEFTKTVSAVQICISNVLECSSRRKFSKKHAKVKHQILLTKMPLNSGEICKAKKILNRYSPKAINLYSLIDNLPLQLHASNNSKPIKKSVSCSRTGWNNTD